MTHTIAELIGLLQARSLGNDKIVLDSLEAEDIAKYLEQLNARLSLGDPDDIAFFQKQFKKAVMMPRYPIPHCLCKPPPWERPVSSPHEAWCPYRAWIEQHGVAARLHQMWADAKLKET